MGKMRGRLFLAVMVPAILGMVGFMWDDLSAANSEGVLKEAIHWGVSADFFDPAITGSHISTLKASMGVNSTPSRVVIGRWGSKWPPIGKRWALRWIPYSWIDLPGWPIVTGAKFKSLY
jgi:hypothetical protein